MWCASVVRVGSILCLLFPPWAAAQTGSQTRTAAETQVGKVPAQHASVHGFLVGSGGQPEGGTEVLLVEAQVWDLSGSAIPKLPASGTTIAGLIGDASGAPVVKGRSRTSADGRFEFQAAPGRYGVAASNPGEKAVALLLSKQQERPVIFDLAVAKEIDLGTVQRKRE